MAKAQFEITLKDDGSRADDGPELLPQSVIDEFTEAMQELAMDARQASGALGEAADKAGDQDALSGFFGAFGRGSARAFMGGQGFSGAAFSGLVEGAGKAGPALMALAAAGSAAKDMFESVRGELQAQTDVLAAYSSEIAGAIAEAEVAAMMRDVERAQRMGTDFAAFQRSSARFDAAMAELWDQIYKLLLQAWEVMEPVMTLLVKVLTFIFEFINGVINFFSGKGDFKQYDHVVKQFTTAAKSAIPGIDFVTTYVEKIFGHVKNIDEKTPDPMDKMDDYTREFLKMAEGQRSFGGAANEGRGAGVGAVGAGAAAGLGV